MNTYYAAKYLDEDIVKASSSGGIFYALAQCILEEKGVVCGAAFNERFEVEHIIVTDSKDLVRIQGSKYVQSKMHNIFQQVYLHLFQGTTVLFSGTPCQVAGLRSFLGKKNDALLSKLITVEIICHGVPSPGIFTDYIAFLENKYKEPLKEYHFRTKDHNKNFVTKIIMTNSIHYVNSLTDPYYAAFLKDLILRPSCYACDFCGKDRNADITIGDFWGSEKTDIHPSLKRGCTLVGCNTSKGESLFKKSSTGVLAEQVSVGFALAKQPQLAFENRKLGIPRNRQQIFAHWHNDQRDVFFSYLRKTAINWEKLLFNCLPTGLIRFIKRFK